MRLEERGWQRRIGILSQALGALAPICAAFVVSAVMSSAVARPIGISLCAQRLSSGVIIPIDGRAEQEGVTEFRKMNISKDVFVTHNSGGNYARLQKIG